MADGRCPILIVDDDPDCSAVLAMLLEDDGCEVAVAGNGRDALALLRRGLAPKVILLDLRMPIMDGWTFARERARQHLAPDAAVVVISSEPVGASSTLRPELVLRKPLEANAVARAVRECCAMAA